MTLARRVLATIRSHRLLASGDRVVIALSGGPDSVALTWVLKDLAPDLGIEIAGLVHLNHQLRAGASDEDERFCGELAVRIGAPIHIEREDIATRAAASRQSIEVVARAARYAVFESAAARFSATHIATGHTLDDQAETVLLRLLRGAGTRGLAGIRFRRGPVVRPLLECRREDVLRDLTDRGESYRHDQSNDDRAIPRNRIRHDLLPVIDDIAPGGRDALARLAGLSTDVEDFLGAAAIEMAPAVVLSVEGAANGAPVVLQARDLGRLPAALARHLIYQALVRIAPGAAITARHVAAVRSLSAADKPKGHLDLPGVAVSRDGELLVLAARRDQGGNQGSPGPFEHVLPLPGSVRVPEAGVTVSVDHGDARVALPDMEDRQMAVLQAASVRPPFVVRSRRPGDRVWPLGAPGHRRLQDVFVDRKVPRERRDRVPIVADANGRIVWVMGLTIAEECRVTAPEAGVVILKSS